MAIKGRTVQFGTGDIRICPIINNDFTKVGIILKQQEGYEVGDKISNTENPIHPEESDVILSFTNPKSIDILMKDLLWIKKHLEGESVVDTYDPVNYEF